MTGPAPLLLTPAQAAQMLAICERTLRKLRAAGLVRYVRVGSGGIRYAPDDLADYIESARTCQSSPVPARPSSGTISRSTVADFEAARKQRMSARRA